MPSWSGPVPTDWPPPSPWPGGPLGPGDRGRRDHRRRHPHRRADPARIPARHLLGRPSVRARLAVPQIAAPGRPRPRAGPSAVAARPSPRRRPDCDARALDRGHRADPRPRRRGLPTPDGTLRAPGRRPLRRPDRSAEACPATRSSRRGSASARSSRRPRWREGGSRTSPPAHLSPGWRPTRSCRSTSGRRPPSGSSSAWRAMPSAGRSCGAARASWARPSPRTFARSAAR